MGRDDQKARRFTLGDAMVLVAASASTLVLVRMPLAPEVHIPEILLDSFARPARG